MALRKFWLAVMMVPSNLNSITACDRLRASMSALPVFLSVPWNLFSMLNTFSEFWILWLMWLLIYSEFSLNFA